jgi:hypothetical protein
VLFALVAGCGIDAEGTFDINSLGPSSQGGSAGGGGFSGSVQVGGMGGNGGSGTGNNGGVSGTSGTGGASGSGGSKPCKFPGECNDNNPCTKDACVDGMCSSTALPGASCADSNKCNGEETCDGTGQCLPGTPLPIDDGKACTIDLCDPATGTINHKGQPDCTCETDADCDDNNACTIDVCKPDGTGKNTCSYTNANAGTSCDDKNKCTVGDQCDTGGKCQGSLIPVDDGNPCTTDSCDPASGQPVHKGNVGQPCSDNNACTIDDACDAKGKCEGFALDPDDNNPCTVDLCDPITGNFTYKGVAGCKSCKGKDSDCDDGNPCTVDTCKVDICDYQDVPPGGDCNDGNACTLGDKCDISGKCVGSLKNVDDGNPCTADSCDPASGNPIYTPAPGQSCTDNNLCTLGDICNEQGQCVGINKSVDDANECTTDACDPASGNVSHTPLPNCKPCSVAADCNDNNPCTNDSCQAGKCAYANASSGTNCSDNNPCTDNDKCNGSGQCVGTPKNVDDGNPCTADSCNPVNGNVVNTPSSGAACNDNNACTLGDQCDVGVCKGTPKSVDDGNECTTDACNPATGNVSHTPLPNCKPCSVAADCNDNNPCTNDSCQAGKCAYANASSGTNCSDNNLCTDNDKCNGSGQCAGTPKTCNTPPNACFTSSGSCNQADGLCVYPLASNGTPCSDNNACTLNDACQAGTCVPGATKTCNAPPNNQCYNSPGTCNPSNGDCSYTTKSSGASCDDSNACTSGDQCNASGTCSGTTITGCKTCNSAADCNDNNPCTNDVCSGGVCSNPNNTASCNDNNPCTDNDTCGNGTCSGTNIPGCKNCNVNSDCNDNNSCTSDICDANKKCTNNNLANGTTCLDGNQCTLNDTCQNGVCTAGPPKVCPDVCNPTTSKITTGFTCQTSNGNCINGTTSDCPGNHTCEDATKCWSACSQANTDDRCADGFYCPNASGPCIAKLPKDADCTHPVQCLSNGCVSQKCE